MEHKNSENKTSVFNVKNTRHDEFKYAGFNYKGKQIRKSVSSYLLRTENISSFVDKLEEFVFFLTENVKNIAKFHNFAMKRNHTKFR